MTLVLDPKRRTYSGQFNHRVFGRVHTALKTNVKAVGMRRHAALELLLDAGEPVRDLVERLRRQQLTIQSIEECVRAKLPFDALRKSVWPPLGIAAEEYRAALEAADGAPKTAWNTKAALAHATAFFGARRSLETIGHEDVTAYRVALLAKGLNPNTVSVYLTQFGAMYAYLQRRETRRAMQQKRQPAILFSPLDRDEHVTAFVPSRLRFLSQEEANRVLAACPPSLRPAVALGLFAGLRGGEIMHLRPELDVDLGSGMLHVQRRPGWQPKYGKNRDVPVSAALRPYLEEALERSVGPYLFARPTDPRQPMMLKYFERHLAQVIRDAELVPGQKDPNGITIHTLRHTFASWLVMKGADLFTIAKLMGHSGIRQVEQTYSHLSPEHTRRTVELLSAEWTITTTTHTAERPHVA